MSIDGHFSSDHGTRNRIANYLRSIRVNEAFFFFSQWNLPCISNRGSTYLHLMRFRKIGSKRYELNNDARLTVFERIEYRHPSRPAGNK